MICNAFIICFMYTLFIYFIDTVFFCYLSLKWVTWKVLINKMNYYIIMGQLKWNAL